MSENPRAITLKELHAQHEKYSHEREQLIARANAVTGKIDLLAEQIDSLTPVLVWPDPQAEKK